MTKLLKYPYNKKLGLETHKNPKTHTTRSLRNAWVLEDQIDWFNQLGE